MTEDQGIRALGLPVGAGREEILAAYRRRSDDLKMRILRSASPAQRDHYRMILRDLVTVRDTALGRARRRGASRPVGLPPDVLLARLGRLSIAELDRDGARRFFGLSAGSPAEQVLHAYEQDRRVLVREFARASDLESMRILRLARNKLRTLRNFAL